MWDKEQNSSRVKLILISNHRWFGSPGLLDFREATHFNLLPLCAPCFDSPCFLLVRLHLKLFVPLKNKSAPICGFIYPNSVNSELCFCVSLLLTFLSLSLTCGCSFPHRRRKRSRRAPRVPWRTRVSPWQGRLNLSPNTLQPTPPCRGSAGAGNDCLSRTGLQVRPRGTRHWSHSVKYFSPCPTAVSLWYLLLVLGESSWHNRKKHSPEEMLLRNPHLGGHLRHDWFPHSFSGAACNKSFAIIRFVEISMNLHHFPILF